MQKRFMNRKNDPLNYEIKFLKGVGENRARLLNKLGINTIGDLMEHFPRDYIQRNSKTRVRDLHSNEVSSIVGEIVSIEKRNYGRNKAQLNVVISDGEEYLFLTWFRFGNWFIKQFEVGKKLWASGVVTEFAGSPQMIHPEIEILEEEGAKDNFWHSRSVLPVYSLTEKVTMNLMRKLIYKAFELYHDSITETLPDSILKKYNFPPRKITLQKIHFSSNISEIPQLRERFAFEELFYNQLMLARSKKNHEIKIKGNVFNLKKTYTTKLKNSLPFDLTTAQKRVITEIVNDMRSPEQMNRLLQGDVGSGKTIITLFAMLLAVENGFQALLMAPTEILVEQHYRSFQSLLQNQPELKIALVKGGNYKGKKQTNEKIGSGEIQIVIGTHALIQKEMIYHKVGFVAIDEQHRFGVEQRAFLTRAGTYPDVMYLSATPIPRSLAMTVYGDLDVSILDELPPNRKPVKTFWRNQGKLDLIYEELRIQLRRGRQVYIVCPLIEESAKIDLIDAETLYEGIRLKIFPEFTSSLLHGKMKTAEKDEIMREFKAGKISLLVSTTVIEVGIDVPNATVMMIEQAERFGLSQLHQLRGRVGRGAENSFCYLIAHPPLSEDGRERLNTMISTNDGFKIAEKDLELRGPGDFFGTVQSGMPAFKHANLLRDQELLKQARVLAFGIISADFDLRKDENDIIREIYFSKYLEKEKLFDY
jgi:ATP-dependent DNA helicase RecG